MEGEPSCLLMTLGTGAVFSGRPETWSRFRKKEPRKVPSAGVGKT